MLADGGHSLEFIPAEKGFPAGYTFAVWAEVSTFVGLRLLKDAQDNLIVTDDRSAYVVDAVYE